MRTYEEVWDEYNAVYTRSAKPGKQAPAQYDRPRLIALCEEMQQVLAGGYGEGFWARRAEMHRKHVDGHVWDDGIS